MIPYGQPCPVCASRPHRESKTRPELRQRRWRDLAAYVKRRDGWACVRCGNRVGLVAHHVVPARDGGLSVAGNLVTLCRACHGLAHSRAGGPAGLRKGGGGRTI